MAMAVTINHSTLLLIPSPHLLREPVLSLILLLRKRTARAARRLQAVGAAPTLQIELLPDVAALRGLLPPCAGQSEEAAEQDAGTGAARVAGHVAVVGEAVVRLAEEDTGAPPGHATDACVVEA